MSGAGCLVNPSGPAQGTVFRIACPWANATVLTGAVRWGGELGGSVPLLRDAPTLSIFGNTEHLAHGWGRVLQLEGTSPVSAAGSAGSPQPLTRSEYSPQKRVRCCPASGIWSLRWASHSDEGVHRLARPPRPERGVGLRCSAQRLTVRTVTVSVRSPLASLSRSARVNGK